MRLRHLVVGPPVGNLGHLRLRRQTAAGAVALWTTAGAAVGSSMAAFPVDSDSTAAGHLRPRRRLWQLVRGRRLRQFVRRRRLATCFVDAGVTSGRRLNGSWALASPTPAMAVGSWMAAGHLSSVPAVAVGASSAVER
jgi:hypothetical protein